MEENNSKVIHIQGIMGWVVAILAAIGFIDLIRLAFWLGKYFH